jgi:phosphate transport system substrate-binding protein
MILCALSSVVSLDFARQTHVVPENKCTHAPRLVWPLDERYNWDMNRALCFLLSASCLLIFPTACAPQPLTVTREPTTVQLVAADSCGPLAEELAAAYEVAHPWATVQVQVFNSSTTERVLRAHEADLALLSWMQESTYEEPLWHQVFARDGIAIIAHPANPFDETGLLHLQSIFRGQIQEWGGTVLIAVSREEGSGTRNAFDGAVLGTHKVTHTAVVMPSNEAVIEYVGRTPGAIGYVSTLRMTESTVAGVRVLPVEGVSPAQAAISDGSYPLSRPLYLAATTDPIGEAREFAQWTLGPQGQAIVGSFGNW